MDEWPSLVADIVTDGISYVLGAGSWLAGNWDQLAGILMSL
jgi:hypothetical protein